MGERLLFLCSLTFIIISINAQQFQNVVKKYIDCYECGVWRGSVDGNIGKPCLNPYAGQTYIAVPGAPISLDQISIKHNCTVCMKIDTWNRQGYQRPRSGYSSVQTHELTRTCAWDYFIRARNWCNSWRTNSGYQTICYCDSALCNSALPSVPHAFRGTLALLAPLLAALALVYWH